MKQTIIVILCIVMLIGCSAKSSYMKKGAIVGGVGTAVTIAALGSKDYSNYSGTIAVVAIIMGLAGTSLGAGVGYLIDEATKPSQDKQMQEMIQSQKTLGL